MTVSVLFASAAGVSLAGYLVTPFLALTLQRAGHASQAGRGIRSLFAVTVGFQTFWFALGSVIFLPILFFGAHQPSLMTASFVLAWSLLGIAVGLFYLDRFDPRGRRNVSRST